MDESITADATRTASPDVPRALPLTCPRCGTIDQPTIGPGAGPPWRSARCRHCGVWLGWLSRYPREERQARRQAARDDAMARKPPSPMQLAYLAALGHVGPPPTTRREASQRIDRLTGKVQP